jgi:hypothetical protein
MGKRRVFNSRGVVLGLCVMAWSGMIWADVVSGHATGKRQHKSKSKHTIGSATSGAGAGKITSDATGKHTRKAGGTQMSADLNPQPLPPGLKGGTGGGNKMSADLNPQPLPPGAHSGGTGGGSGKVQSDLNPQPLPPGVYAPPGQGGPSALKPVGGVNKVQ